MQDLWYFVLAFLQADMDVDVYMELPHSFTNDSESLVIIKLKKNLYRLKQVANKSVEMLKNGIKAR